MISKPAETSVPLSPVIAERWSTRAFEHSFKVSDEQLLRLLEAARWAPSSMNAQPWRFIAGRQGEPVFDVIAANLAGFNQEWAPHASALIVGCFEANDVNGKPRRSAPYDLGLAVSNLCFQAHLDGLATHQVGGFNRDAIAAALELDENIKPFVVVAVGKAAGVEGLSDELASRESAPRHRMELSDIVIAGLPV